MLLSSACYCRILEQTEQEASRSNFMLGFQCRITVWIDLFSYHVTADVIAMVNHILGNTPSTSFKPQAADINKDGNIDISDVVSLVNMILGQ